MTDFLTELRRLRSAAEEENFGYELKVTHDYHKFLRDHADEIEVLVMTAARVVRWHGEFPPTGDIYANGKPMSYGVAYG